MLSKDNTTLTTKLKCTAILTYKYQVNPKTTAYTSSKKLEASVSHILERDPILNIRKTIPNTICFKMNDKRYLSCINQKIFVNSQKIVFNGRFRYLKISYTTIVCFKYFSCLYMKEKKYYYTTTSTEYLLLPNTLLRFNNFVVRPVMEKVYYCTGKRSFAFRLLINFLVYSG